MRLSANLGFLWPDLPLTDRILAAGRAGFRAVELHWPYDTPARDVAAAAQAAGVTVLGLNSPRGNVAAGEFGIACLPGREEEFRDSIALSVQYARQIGAGALHVMAGKPGDLAPEDWQPRLAARLAHAADAAPDLTILMEPLNRSDNPGYAYATLDAADHIRRMADRPNLRLMFDAYHVAMEGQAPADCWHDWRDSIGHVQIAGYPGRAEPRPDRAPLAALFRALSDDGYSGWIGCEYRPFAGTDAGLGWRDRIPALA